MAHDIFGIELGEGAEIRRHDIARAQQSEQFADERLRPRRVRTPVHFEIDAGPVAIAAIAATAGGLPAADPMHCGVDRLFERGGTLGHAENTAENLHRAADVGIPIRVQRKNRDAEFAQTIDAAL